jgi:outer membrane protein assembly factor BamA
MAQDVLRMQYSALPPEITLPQNVPLTVDSLSSQLEIGKIRDLLLKSGYLTAGIDTIDFESNQDTAIANVYVGPRFKWALMSNGSVPEELLSKIGFRDELYFQEALSSEKIERLFSRILDQSENTGYPFAQVYLEDVRINADSIRAILQLNRGPLVILDSLIIKGDLASNRRYIENYIGFKKNKIYNQGELNTIPSRLKEIPFVQSIKPYEVGMRPGKADVYLYLKPRKSSNFDGVLGVLPDPVTGEILFTGDIQLNLLNSFKRGETINLEWQRLQTQTSQLDVKFKYPFLFNTPLGTDFNFNLYRRDTTFSQNRINVGVEYYFVGSNTIRVFYENQGANTIGNVESVSSDLADSRTNLFGIGTTFSNLDYRFNPRKGLRVNASIAAGQKEITSELPEDAASRTDVYNINLESSYFIPLFKRSALHFKVQGGLFLNENMFRNEIYRIGGLRTLRGFDEQAIFASAFGIGTIEYRFILEQNSNLFLFFDQAFYEDQARQDIISDDPFGFGAGVNFETGAGVFSLTYALGKQFDNNISIRGGKVHFGFISFF